MLMGMGKAALSLWPRWWWWWWWWLWWWWLCAGGISIDGLCCESTDGRVLSGREKLNSGLGVRVPPTEYMELASEAADGLRSIAQVLGGEENGGDEDDDGGGGCESPMVPSGDGERVRISEIMGRMEDGGGCGDGARRCCRCTPPPRPSIEPCLAGME